MLILIMVVGLYCGQAFNLLPLNTKLQTCRKHYALKVTEAMRGHAVPPALDLNPSHYIYDAPSLLHHSSLLSISPIPVLSNFRYGDLGASCSAGILFCGLCVLQCLHSASKILFPACSAFEITRAKPNSDSCLQTTKRFLSFFKPVPATGSLSQPELTCC